MRHWPRRIGRARLRLGMAGADRRAFRDRARAALKSKFPHPGFAKAWDCGLVQHGGPEGTRIILDARGQLDANGRSEMLEFGIKAP